MAEQLTRPDRCSNCGASFTPGLAWCGQCYAPIPAVPVPEPARRPTDYLEPIAWTRWHATAETFGPATKISITAAAIGLGVVILGMYLRAVSLVGTAYIVGTIVTTAALVVGGFFFFRHLWRPGPR